MNEQNLQLEEELTQAGETSQMSPGALLLEKLRITRDKERRFPVHALRQALFPEERTGGHHWQSQEW